MYNLGKISTAAVIEKFCNFSIVNTGFRISMRVFAKSRYDKCGMTERGWIPAEVYPCESKDVNVMREPMARLLIKPKVKPHPLLISVIAACPQSFWSFKKDSRPGESLR